MGSFYITTPIFYVNDKPHLGTAYCTITADVLARYHRLFGDETFFLTGTDEHGQKAQEAAAKRGLTPQQHCDEMSKNFQHAWKEMNASNDIFYRTTNPSHIKAVQDCLQQLWDAGDEIYSNEYEGWYSVSEEIFYTEKDLVNGKSPEGNEVIRLKEKNYFFKMSKYQQRLIEHIEKNPEFIQPDFRKNEVLGFLRQPLGDLCISRPKSRMSWGVEMPFDKDYVTYVWFDALLNYATAQGLKQKGREAEYKKWWEDTRATHLVGKDILTTHAVYWPTMLMALKMELPKTIFATGWILNRDAQKMSKSKGDVINPVDLKNEFGLDQLRYFLVRDVHMGNDAPFSHDLLKSRVNAELANNLGNMASRTFNLIEKFYGGKVPPFKYIDEAGHLDDVSNQLKAQALELGKLVKKEVETFRTSYALDHIVRVLTAANKYLEDKAPWKMAKEDLAGAGSVLATSLEVLRICAILLSPVMPDKMDELLKRLGMQHVQVASRIGSENAYWNQVSLWPGIPTGTAVQKGEPLFPRME